MTYTPTVRVEVAFGFGPYDPEPLALDWDDITSSVLEVVIERGRESEFDRFPASTATVVLLNSSREWDPLNAAGTYYGQLLPNVPIRIIGEISGTDYPVWRGYVDGWPATYTEGGFHSEVEVTCTDAFRILAERRMPDALDALLTSFGMPDAWYRCDTAAGNVLVNSGSMGRDGTILTAVTAVDPLVTPSDKALLLPEQTSADAAKYTWAAQIPIVSDTADNLTTGTTWSISVLIQMANRGFRSIFDTETATASLPTLLVVNSYSSGFNTITALVDGGTNLVINGITDVGDGNVHHVVLVRDGTSLYLYVDGVLDGSDTDAGATTSEDASAGRHLIGRSPLGPSVPGPAMAIDELMIFSGRALSSSEVTSLRASILYGFEGEVTSGVAIGDALDHVSWLSGLRSLDTGEMIVAPPANPKGTSVLELLQRHADSEGGRLFVDAEGKVTFHSRDRFLRETVENTIQYTFTDTNRDTTPTDVGILDGSLRIVLDDRNVYEAAEATRTGGVTQRAGSTTPARTWTASDLLVATDAAALSLAEWTVFRYATPQVRSDAWEVDPEIVPADWPDILGLEVGHRIKLDLTPGNVGSSIDLELHVSYIAHEITPERWLVTLNGTPIDPNDYFLWDSTATASTTNGWRDGTDDDPLGGAWG